MLPVELGWQVGGTTGWQLYGLWLSVGLAREGRRVHIPDTVEWNGIPHTLRPLIQQMTDHGDMTERRIRIDGSGNHFPSAPDIPNRLKVCLAIFEDTHCPNEKKGCWATFDRIISCSTWTQNILKGWGVESERWLQASDESLFYRSVRRRPLDAPFYIFIGGKLELRKAAPIAIEAFRRFLNTPEGKDAVLVTALANRWPATMDGVWEDGYCKGVPVTRLGQLDVVSWLEANGIPRENAMDLGTIKQTDLASVIRECDAAIFSNRAESASNMMLPEVMMSGVPCIISQNTGHLDATPPEGSFPLVRQGPVTVRTPLFVGYDGWGESDPAEILEHLLTIARMSHAERMAFTEPASTWARENFGWLTQSKTFNTLLTKYENA